MQTEIPEIEALFATNPGRTAWTPEMEAQMKKYYPRCAEAGAVRHLVEALNRQHECSLTLRAVYNKALQMGLTR